MSVPPYLCSWKNPCPANSIGCSNPPQLWSFLELLQKQLEIFNNIMKKSKRRNMDRFKANKIFPSTGLLTEIHWTNGRKKSLNISSDVYNSVLLLQAEEHEEQQGHELQL